MSKRMRFAVIPLAAGALVASATASAWAFTQETLYPNGNYNFNYGALDKDKSSGFTSKTDDPNSSGWHFNVQGGSNQFGSSGFRSFNGNDDKPDVPGSRPIGNGN